MMRGRRELTNKKKEIKASVSKTVIEIRIKKRIKASVSKTVTGIHIEKENKKRRRNGSRNTDKKESKGKR
jgi:hypothetical protein